MIIERLPLPNLPNSSSRDYRTFMRDGRSTCTVDKSTTKTILRLLKQSVTLVQSIWNRWRQTHQH